MRASNQTRSEPSSDAMPAYYVYELLFGAIARSKISREKSERVLPAFLAALSSLSASPQGRLSGKLTRRSPSIRGRPIRFAVQVVILLFLFFGKNYNVFYTLSTLFLKINKKVLTRGGERRREPLKARVFFLNIQCGKHCFYFFAELNRVPFTDVKSDLHFFFGGGYFIPP